MILTVNDEGTIETELLLIDGKKQAAPPPLIFIATKINGIFRAMLNGDSFVNEHLRKAVVDRFSF